jgi:hypothetical protein
MTGQGEMRKIRAHIRRVNHRLSEKGTDSTNADRALWGALAVAHFAGETCRAEDMRTDPETVIADLLADLMHCAMFNGLIPNRSARSDSTLPLRGPGIITRKRSARNWNSASAPGGSGRLAQPFESLPLVPESF